MVNRVSSAGPEGLAHGEIEWPVRSGAVPPLSPTFVSRPESAANLDRALAPGRTVALIPASEAPAPGFPDWLGSCGKTQLAAYTAESLWRSGEIELLVWIDAVSEAAVVSSYADAAVAATGIGRASDAEALATGLVGWLATTDRSWLVVLNNLSRSQDMAGLWPTGPAGRTLITTTEPGCLPDPDACVSVPLGGFSRREALSYLLGRLTEDRGQRTGAIDLADRLGGEPLALAQASTVIEDSALSCRDYLDHFDRKRGQLGIPDRGSPAAAVTWTLSVEHAYRLLPGGQAQPLLILASMLDCTAIPATVFTTGAATAYTAGSAGGLSRPEDVWMAVTSLARTGLVDIDPATSPPTVRMNPALQTAVRSVTPGDMLDRAVLTAADALLEAWPEDESDSRLARDLRSCAEHVTRLAGELLWSADRYQLLFRAGRSLEAARLTRLAAALWTDIAAAAEQFLGIGHPDALMATDQLAAAFLGAGRAADALPWFQRVLADRNTQLGPERPATIAAAVRLGSALLEAGRADDAVKLLERVVSDCGRLLGPTAPDTLQARETLAAAYGAAGQAAEGLRRYQRSLADREKIQGPTHPATMATGIKLGDAYLAADKPKDAISAYKKVISGREKALGPDHPDTIAARGSLAGALQTAGRMATALQSFEEVKADSERVLGPDHPDTLRRAMSLAQVYYAVGRLGDATNLLRDTAERCDRVLPPADPLAQTVRESLANLTGNVGA